MSVNALAPGGSGAVTPAPPPEVAGAAGLAPAVGDAGVAPAAGAVAAAGCDAECGHCFRGGAGR